jgi:N-acetylmuramoyl-L-alanine amidase
MNTFLIRLMFFAFCVSLTGHPASLKDYKHKRPTVVLDPGHGGIYHGQTSVNKKLVEKKVALEITLQVAELLKKRNYRVILTRSTDTQLDKDDLIRDLTLRAQMGNIADMYVSLHLNGSTNQKIRGYEVYVPYMAKYPRKSYALASAMHYELSHLIEPVFGGGSLGNLNNIDHGIKAAKFNVLVKAQCPAILVEMDYLTNPTSEELLMTQKYKNLLVKAVYRGIRRYFLSTDFK